MIEKWLITLPFRPHPTITLFGCSLKSSTYMLNSLRDSIPLYLIPLHTGNVSEVIPFHSTHKIVPDTDRLKV